MRETKTAIRRNGPVTPIQYTIDSTYVTSRVNSNALRPKNRALKRSDAQLYVPDKRAVRGSAVVNTAFIFIYNIVIVMYDLWQLVDWWIAVWEVCDGGHKASSRKHTCSVAWKV